MLADRPDGRRLNAAEQRQLEDLERRLLSGPLAPPRAVPVGLAATRRWSAVAPRLLIASFAVVIALLVLATVVGGPGGLAATASTLLATLLVCRARRIRLTLRWPRARLRPWLRDVSQ